MIVSARSNIARLLTAGTLLSSFLLAQADAAPQLPIPNGLLESGVKFDRFEYDGFRQMLQLKGLRVVTLNYRQALRKPRNSIIVILGGTEKLHAMKSRIYTFYKDGGALLVANDQSDHRFLFDFRTWFNQGTSTFNGPDTLMSFADCPLVTDTAAPLLFDNVQSIATNRPGYLSFRDADAQSYTAAWLPPDSRGMSESFIAVRHYRDTPGRLLAVADHSIFTNQMLMHGSNLAFANNVIDWLVASGDREKLIFIREGEVMPTYSIGTQLPPIPPDQLLDAMSEVLKQSRPNPFDSSFREFTNNALQSLQQKDTFNFAVHSWQSKFRNKFVRRAAAIGCAALLVTLLVVRLITNRKRDPDMAFFRAAKQKDHSATARLLIRDFFVRDNLTDRPESTRPVAISDSWWTRRRLQRSLRWLWKYGSATTPKRTSAKQLEKLRKQLQRLDKLRDDGRLRVQWEQ